MAVRRELMTEALLERAAKLFAERGFEQTSLQVIASSMGLSRPALYHYIDSKEDLLKRLVEDMTEAALADDERLRARTDLAPIEKLREFIRIMAIRVAERPHRFRLLVIAEASLSPPVMQAHARLKRMKLSLAVDLVQDVAATGAMRPLDPRVTALAIVGMTNWLAWWYSPEGELSGETIGEELATLVIEGLVLANEGENGAGVSGALQRLRRDVECLEHLIGA